MDSFKAKTVQVIVEKLISAMAKEIFPLCCPVEEYIWIDGWKCELINCPNNRIEQGCVFYEFLSAPFLLDVSTGKTTWTAILHDTENYRLHFRLDNAISSSLYKIELKQIKSDITKITLDFTYEALKPKGNSLIEKNIENNIRFMLSLLAEMLRYYCETGEMLKTLSLAKRILCEYKFKPINLIKIALNKIAMALL